MSAATAAVDLQNAIYDALAAAPLGVVGIYDNPRQVANPDDNTEFPFVTVGDATLSEWDDDTTSGFDMDVVLHVWSRAHHHLEAKKIQGAIYAALHRFTLVVGGVPAILCDHQSSDALRDPDGVTIHGISRYRVVLTP